ncbi:homoserine kinase [Salinicoccus jeotgali]|uniref:Homoserine kinase n=2 Tax=Salinicoccus jeotgali TaxID=381634 RepID=A0ABP7EC62_9STAP
MHHFKVPATSANLGPGFDSVGLALEKYLYIKAKEGSGFNIIFEDDFLDVLPHDESNLVIRTAQDIARKYGCGLPGLEIRMGSDIPLSHGLGSSASAIVAGIELADRFCGLGLTAYDKVFLGSEIEGHPDNVGPAVTGGLFVGYYDGELFYHVLDVEGLSAIISVPPYEVETQEARRALPETYSKQDAVRQNALNNVLLLSIMNNDYSTMHRLMTKDRYHEPYRRQFIAEYDEVRRVAEQAGAIATTISGAGPTLLTLCKSNEAAAVFEQLDSVRGCHHEKVDICRKIPGM